MRCHARATGAETSGVAYLKEGVRSSVKKHDKEDTIGWAQLGEGVGGFRGQYMSPKGVHISTEVAPPYNNNMSRAREDTKQDGWGQKKNLN